MTQQSEYMTGYNNGWADAIRDKKERRTATQPVQEALSEEVLLQAIADTAARGHVWASRALSNYHAARK